MTRRIRAPILVFSRGDAAIASDPLGAYWVLSQLALCSLYISTEENSGGDADMKVDSTMKSRVFLSGITA